MDIRKFFGSASTNKPKTENKSSDNSKKDLKRTDQNKKSDTLKTGSSQSKSANNKTQRTSSPSKKASITSKLQKDEEAVIVEDFSDEEVVKSPKIPKQSSNKDVGKGSKPKRESSQSRSKERTKKTKDLDKEEVIDIDSTQSSTSSSVGSSKNGSKEGKKKSSTLSDQRDKEKNDKFNSSSMVAVRSSPRKHNSSAKEEKKSRKRILSEEDEDDDFKAKKTEPKQYTFDSEESDTEEVLSIRRKGNNKSKRKSTKKKVLDSDSDEDPLAETKPPKFKRKKSSAHVIPESDEEDQVVKETAMDRFVIHNAKTPKEDVKSQPKKNDSTSKVTPVSVADFFGEGSASRSSRKTAVAKRKLDDSEKEVEPSEVKIKAQTVDLTFDEEMHDDEDFMKTLDQLDESGLEKQATEAKKSKSPNENEVSNKTTSGSIAQKLAGKMKEKPLTDNGNDNNVEPKKVNGSAPKANSKKSSPKKGRIYTMEVTKDKSKPVSTPDKQKEASPVKQPVRPTNSTLKVKDADEDDDGFGGPKAIKGFQAFKQRGGPLALGSKEIPEGAENSMEGLTFVITGVLDSIDRDDAKSLIERHGGKVTGNVSGRTSYVVVGREPGESKTKKAAQLKVKQIDEDGLFDLVRTLPGKTSKYEIQAKEQMKKETSLKAEKEKEEQKKASAAKKLESFCAEKVTAGASGNVSSSVSPKKETSLFTQLKNSQNQSSGDDKLLSQSPSQKSLKTELKDSSAEGAGEPNSLLWVDKHKPTALKQIIGQQGDKSNARKLLAWLKAWHNNIIVKGLKPSGNFFNKGDGAGCRAALLSGPPGIGKTTTATLVCQELGFSYVELNASDTRSKRSLKEVVAESLNNNTLMDYTGQQHGAGRPSGHNTGQSHCLIMDEVDGMAGNEDRGGLQELVQLIKKSKIPIICICNDRNSMKMRTLSNYCLDLRFQRPRVEQIKGAMMSLAFKEGLKIPPAALNEIILASNHDIRQVIHNMSVWSVGDKIMTFEQVKADAQKAQKDIKLGPFDVCRKVFVNDDETSKMNINEKSDLFFNDYSFGPLFVHENYVKIIPNSAGGNHSKHLSCLARTIDSICDGDLVDKLVRREGNWNLLPTQAMFSSVIPGEVMRGSFPQMTDFPQWLGKFSSTNKTNRILQELSMHMALEVSCDKRGLNLDYLPSFRTCLTQPLVSQGSEGVPEVIKVMDDYDIIKEDFDNILEITKWPGSFDPMAKLESKTKAAFTRQYNKEIHMTPYATGAVGGKKRRGRGVPMEDEGVLEEGGEGGEAAPPDSEEEEEESIDVSSMIKTKKAGKGKTTAQSASTSAKGKGKGKGSKK